MGSKIVQGRLVEHRIQLQVLLLDATAARLTGAAAAALHRSPRDATPRPGRHGSGCPGTPSTAPCGMSEVLREGNRQVVARCSKHSVNCLWSDQRKRAVHVQPVVNS